MTFKKIETMRIEADKNGYIFVTMPNGEKRYVIVDVPNTAYYGLLKLGEPIEVIE